MKCVDRKVSSNGCNGRKCKTVRITPEPQVLNCVETLDEMSDQERFHGWWQPDEYEGTKADAKTKCRKMRRLGDAEGSLSEAYDRACSIAATSETDLDAIHSAQVLTPDEVCLYFNESLLCNKVVIEYSVLTHDLYHISCCCTLTAGSRSLV
jgi:hypothetical protein